MSDYTQSASELRARYAHGGSAAVSELSASQLRARNDIQSNRAGAQRPRAPRRQRALTRALRHSLQTSPRAAVALLRP